MPIYMYIYNGITFHCLTAFRAARTAAISALISSGVTVFFSDIDCRLDADEIASVVLDLIGQSYRVSSTTCVGLRYG